MQPPPSGALSIHGPDTPANGLDHCDGDAVACLFIGLSVRVDGEDPVNLLILEPLQAQALSGHQAADASAALHDALYTGGVMGDLSPDPSGAVWYCLDSPSLRCHRAPPPDSLFGWPPECSSAPERSALWLDSVVCP